MIFFKKSLPTPKNFCILKRFVIVERKTSTLLLVELIILLVEFIKSLDNIIIK